MIKSFFFSLLLLAGPAPLVAQDPAPELVFELPPEPPLETTEAPEAGRGDNATEEGDADAPVPKPAIWTLGDEDTTLYLFGTIHSLPKGFVWRSERLNEIIEQSDTLYVEISDDKLDIIKFLAMLGRKGVNLDHPPIRERIDPELHGKFEQVLEDIPIPERGFDNLDSWLAGIMIYEFGDDGMEGGIGADAALETEFTLAGKPVRSLESGIEHYGFFDTLSEEAQLAFLEGMIASVGDKDEDGSFQKMIEDWRDGVVKTAEEEEPWFPDEELGEELEAEFSKAILDDRNIAWVELLQRVMDRQEGVILVAAGAAHFRGENSVIDLFEKAGFSVLRVD